VIPRLATSLSAAAVLLGTSLSSVSGAVWTSYLAVEVPGTGSTLFEVQYESTSFANPSQITGADLLDCIFGSASANGVYADAFGGIIGYSTATSVHGSVNYLDFGTPFVESFEFGGTTFAQDTDYDPSWIYFAAGGAGSSQGGAYASGVWTPSLDGVATRFVSNGSFDAFVLGGVDASFAPLVAPSVLPTAGDFASAVLISKVAVPEPSRALLLLGGTCALLRGAFTLVELLVVLVIGGLIIGLSSIAISKVKSGAGRISCASNLRNLGVAVQLHCADQNGMFPPYLQRTAQGSVWYFGLETTQWTDGETQRDLDLSAGPLSPYLAEIGGIERCPAFNYGSASWKPKYKTPSWGYGYNWRLGGGFGGEPMHNHQIDRASNVILFGDCAQINTFQPPASPDNPLMEEFYIINETYKTVHFRHGGLANMVFVDGRVEAFRPDPGTLDERLPGAKLGRISPSGSTDYLE